MTHVRRCELPIFSATFESDPLIRHQDMDTIIELNGADDKDKQRHITVVFKTVVCSKFTSTGFTPKLYDSMDCIVELINSDWLIELQSNNDEAFKFWNPKHYIVYFDGIGMLQFIAQGFEVIE